MFSNNGGAGVGQGNPKNPQQLSRDYGHDPLNEQGMLQEMCC